MTLLELGLTPETGVTFGVAFRELMQEGVASQPFQRVQIESSEYLRVISHLILLFFLTTHLSH